MTRTMMTTTAATVLALLAGEAGARQTLAASYTGQFTNPGDLDRYTVDLTAGEHYALGGYAEDAAEYEGGATITVREPGNAGGKVVKRTSLLSQDEIGVEFTARVTGRYAIEVLENRGEASWPISYSFHFGEDCAFTTATRCAVQVGTTVPGLMDSAYDRDWVRLTLPNGKGLRAGAAYTLIAESGPALSVEVADLAGTILATGGDGSTLKFTPARSGTFFARISAGDDVGGPITVSLHQAP